MIADKVMMSDEAGAPYVLGSYTGGTVNSPRKIAGASLVMLAADIAYSHEDLPGFDMNGWGLAACSWNKGRGVFVGQTSQPLVHVPGSTLKGSFVLGSRSADGGKTWSQVSIANFLTADQQAWFCLGLAATPDGSVLVMTAQCGDISRGQEGSQILYSLDQGASWSVTAVSNGASVDASTATLRLGQVSYCKRLGKFFVAGTGKASSLACGAVWSSSDGVTWTPVLELPSANEGAGVTDQFFLGGVASDQKRGLLAVGYKRWDDSPHTTVHFYLAAWYSTDGATWQLANGGYAQNGDVGVSTQGMDFVSCAGDGKGDWCAALNGIFFPWTGSNVGACAGWRTSDDGQSWTQSGLPIPTGGANTGCASLAAQRGRFYATVFAYGIDGSISVAGAVHRSIGGASWTQLAALGTSGRPKAIAVAL